ncbi:hypothetical protein NFI96_018296, partial [Prochilodus magdalenae]
FYTPPPCPTLRLTSYLPEESKAVLTSHHASVQHQVSVQTTFVEPFNPIVGAQYITLGEIDKSDGESVPTSMSKRALEDQGRVDVCLSHQSSACPSSFRGQ